MRCIDPGLARAALPLLALLLASCNSTPLPRWPQQPPPAPTVPAAVPPVVPPVVPTPPKTPAPSAAAPDVVPPARPAAPDATPARRHVPLGPPAAARNWDEFRLQAAQRLVQSNPDGTYTGAVPEPLLAIPVLEVELNADGSVRRVQVLRHPSQAKDTTQLAIDAVHRAAPYGAMSRLRLPWKWTEVFLFDDARRFKPRELDK